MPTTNYPAKELARIKRLIEDRREAGEDVDSDPLQKDLSVVLDYLTETKPRAQRPYDHPVIQKAGALYEGVPVLLGYLEVAEKIPKQVPVRYDDGLVYWELCTNPDGSSVHVGASAIRNYLYKDIKGGEPNLMPRPDALLVRGDTILPGWYEETIDQWVWSGRSGPGNHTSGEGRRGNTKGRRPPKIADVA